MSTPPDSLDTDGHGPVSAAAPARGVIHDIGYQHYDGERLGRSYIRRSLFVESLKGAYGLGRAPRSKIMPMTLFVAMCLPALVIVVVTAMAGADALMGGYTSYLINLQFVVAIYVAGQAPANVSRDLRFGVMSLIFSRPLERIDYVTAKYAAMACAVFLLLAVPLMILFLGALVAGLPISEQLPDLARSLGGGLVAAVVVSGIGRVIAAATPRRGLGVAAVVTVLLVLIAVQGAAHELAVHQGREALAGYLALLSPFTLADGVQSGLLGAQSMMVAAPLDIAGGLVFLGVAALVSAGAFGVLMLRYRKVSVS